MDKTRFDIYPLLAIEIPQMLQGNIIKWMLSGQDKNPAAPKRTFGGLSAFFGSSR